MPPDAPLDQQSEYLFELATALLDLFENDGSLATLNRAIATFEHSLVLAVQVQDPDVYMNFHSLGNALEERIRLVNTVVWDVHQRHAIRADINRAIEVYKEACDRAPIDAIDRPTYYNNLGGVYIERFERDSDPKDLDNAISAYTEAFEIAKERGKRSATYLHNLGYALQSRCEFNGSESDLKSCLKFLAEAVQLANDEKRASFSNDYANALQLQFRRTGRLVALNDAIAYYRQAIKVSHPNDTHYTYFLNNLGNALQRRYSWTGSLDDLEGAIKQYEILQQCYPKFSHTPQFLSNFGIAQRCLFHHDDTNPILKYLDAAIELFNTALDHAPPGHPYRSMCVANIGISLLDRFEETPSEYQLLDRARDLYRAALQYRRDGEGDPDRGRLSHSLGLILSKKYQYEKQIGLLEEAISSYREAIQCTPMSQPDHTIYLISLGENLKDYYDNTNPKNSTYLSESTNAFQLACQSSTASLSTRIVAAIFLLKQMDQSGPGYAIANDALQIAIKLLPMTASYNLRRADQQYNLMAYFGLASSAAAISL